MRIVAIAFALCLALAPVASADDWPTDFAAASKKAKSSGSLILVEFTGSDWCKYCKALQVEVFETKEFKDWAKTLVLLEVDFPMRKKLPAALVKQNEALQKKYRITTYPTVLFLDSEGKAQGKLGYMKGGVEVWLAAAKKIVADWQRKSGK